MSFKKIILGDKTPDKDDPKYKELHEKSFAAGSTFARKTRLDRMAASVQRFARKHPKIFLGIIFSIVLFCVGFNLYRIATAVKRPVIPSSAVQIQEQQLRLRRHHSNQDSVNEAHEIISPEQINQ